MSFWSFLPQILPTVIAAGATVYGAKQASHANDKAANVMADATREGTAAQVAGLDAARQELAVNRAAASPGLMATQDIIARGAALNPQQETAVADSRAIALNSLKGSSLRGSARATSAIVSDTDQRVRDNLMAQNQARADSAATGLASQYFGAGNSMANTAAQTGTAVSQGLVDTGTIQGANAMGQGALRGQAIGDVGAIIADSVKGSMQKERESIYKPIAQKDIDWNRAGARV